MSQNPTIIPIASGKGGTGKSIFTANLAIALAGSGYKTIAIDLDLGGSSLFPLFGLKNTNPGIGDYLLAKRAQLDELLVKTEFPNLEFLPGDVQSPFMANIPYTQKLRLIRNIEKLPAEYILLDLGSGSSFNTLDFFGMSNRSLLITTFEYTSILNMLTFLKNSIFRTIERAIIKNKEHRKLIRKIYKETDIVGDISTQSLYERISEFDRNAAELLAKFTHNFRPRVIFNMGKHSDFLYVLEQIDAGLKKILSINVDYFGFISKDEAVSKSIEQKVALTPNFRKSSAVEDIEIIADRIVRIWNHSLNNTAEILQQKTEQLFEARLNLK